MHWVKQADLDEGRRHNGLTCAEREEFGRRRIWCSGSSARPARTGCGSPFIANWSGFLHLAVVLDAWSHRVVGWAMAFYLRTELVLDALGTAIQQRRPTGVIHDSDQGNQYTSIAFGRRCQEAGVRPSMGQVGDCYDIGLCESFSATLECELLDRRRFRSQYEARQAVFDFIEGWYNPHRRHSSLGYASPARFEMAAAHGGSAPKSVAVHQTGQLHRRWPLPRP